MGEQIKMIRVFILYYLNIKPTHGYEIQRYFQVSGMEQWMKVQSGSIYYALTKLEKEKLIVALREEGTGARVRKIYGITEAGKEALQKELLAEVRKPISEVGSPKFILDLMIGELPKEKLTEAIKEHIHILREQKEFWKKWQKIKGNEIATKLQGITFQMTVDHLQNQILWHEELLEYLDLYMEQSRQSKIMLQSFDFVEVAEKTQDMEVSQQLDYALKLREMIVKEPDRALDNLDNIILELQKAKR